MNVIDNDILNALKAKLQACNNNCTAECLTETIDGMYNKVWVIRSIRDAILFEVFDE